MLGFGFFASSFYVERRYIDRIVTAEDAPEAQVALVFGAGLESGGVPSEILAERLDTAITLYQSRKVGKLLVSGDNSERYHDETGAMRRYAIDRGIPAEDVVGDFAGLSTYDTCYRAKAVFGIERALLVTQEFHLPRALFLANSLGLEAYGVRADKALAEPSRYEMRELFSRPLALAMVLLKTEPKLLGPRSPIDGPGR